MGIRRQQHRPYCKKLPIPLQTAEDVQVFMGTLAAAVKTLNELGAYKAIPDEFVEVVRKAAHETQEEHTERLMATQCWCALMPTDKPRDAT